MAGPRKPPGMQANAHRRKQIEKHAVNTVNLPGIPDSCPPAKSKEWQDIYLHVTNSARLMGIDSETDLPTIYEFCEMHCEIMRLKRKIVGPDGEEQYSKLNRQGDPIINPDYAAILRLRPLYHKMLGELGLTPRSRSYMHDKRKTNTGKVETLLDILNTDE